LKYLFMDFWKTWF